MGIPMPKRKIQFIPAATLVMLVLGIAGIFASERFATRIMKQEIDWVIQETGQSLDIRYEEFGVSWLSFRVYLKNVRLAKPALPGEVKIARISVRDFSSLGITQIPFSAHLDDVCYEYKGVKVSIARINATAFLHKPVLLTRNGWPGLVEALRQGGVKLRDLAISTETVQILLAAAELSLAAETDKVGRLSLKKAQIDLDQKSFDCAALTLAATLDRYNILTQLSGSLKNLYFSLSPRQYEAVRPLQTTLQRLGYDAVMADLGLGHTYDAAKQELTIGLTASAPDMGELALVLQGGNYRGVSVPLHGGLFDAMVFFGTLQNVS